MTRRPITHLTREARRLTGVEISQRQVWTKAVNGSPLFDQGSNGRWTYDPADTLKILTQEFGLTVPSSSAAIAAA